MPIPVRAQDKAADTPAGTSLKNYTITQEQIEVGFGPGHNIGIVLGTPSRGVADIDVDWPEAEQLIDLFFPSSWSFGRLVEGAGMQLRHLLLHIPDAKTKQLLAPADLVRDEQHRKPIIELLSTGNYVVGPGSIHKDTGALIDWIDKPSADNPLAELSVAEAEQACQQLAGAALLAYLWPSVSQQESAEDHSNRVQMRHKVLQHLTGALVHAGWDHLKIANVLWRIIDIAHDDEPRSRQKVISSTLDRAKNGEAVSGLPSLRELQALPESALDQLVTWWSLGSSGPNIILDHTDCAWVTANASLTIKYGDQLMFKQVHWLWDQVIPRQHLTMFSGDPGSGKSTTTANIAAIVTTGGEWPAVPGLSSDCKRRSEPGRVLILSAEDHPEETIGPRLVAAGADMSKIVFVTMVQYDTGVERLFDLTADARKLERTLQELGDCRLIIVDPVDSYLGKGVDTNNNASLRQALNPLVSMLARHDVACVAINHLGKSEKRKTLYRLLGSVGYSGLPRAVILSLKDPDDPDILFFHIEKANLGPSKVAIRYSIHGKMIHAQQMTGEKITLRDISYIEWEDAEFFPNDPDTADAADNGRPSPQLNKAMNFLLEMLKDGKRVRQKELEEQAHQAGHAWRTVQRAKDRLGVESRKRTKEEDPETPWEWWLTAKAST